MRTFLRIASWIPVICVAACSGGTGTDPQEVTVDGGTKPPDGAPGACCPAAMLGGCADMGGYTADGSGCRRLCDGMCNPRLVDDEHGCKRVDYDPCSGIDGGSD